MIRLIWKLRANPRRAHDGGSENRRRTRDAGIPPAAGAPQKAEVGLLLKLYGKQLARYRADNSAALKLLGIGESDRNASLDSAELAAWTMVASAILNLDETVTKG